MQDRFQATSDQVLARNILYTCVTVDVIELTAHSIQLLKPLNKQAYAFMGHGKSVV